VIFLDEVKVVDQKSCAGEFSERVNSLLDSLACCFNCSSDSVVAL
jgi:hypothetical protein